MSHGRGLSLAILIFGIFLLITEVMVSNRVPFFSYDGQRAQVEELKRIVLRWRPDPNFHHVGEGWRAMHFPERLKPGQTRLMIVGDSFVMGHGVGAEGRFGNVLSLESDPQRAIAVLGTSSHSTVVYRNTIRRALERSDYEFALIFIDQTDPVDDWLYTPDLSEDDGDWKFRMETLRDRYVLLSRLISDFDREFANRPISKRHIALYNLAKPVDLLDKIPRESPHRDYVHGSLVLRGEMLRKLLIEPNSPTSRALVARTLAYASDLKDELRAKGVQVLFAANPWQLHVTSSAGGLKGIEASPPLENHLEMALRSEFAGEEGVEVLPLTRMFREHKSPDQLFLEADDEIHWSRLGHRYLARQLDDYIRAREGRQPTSSANPVDRNFKPRFAEHAE